MAAVAAGVHYVSEYIRDHQYTVGELETAVYRFDGPQTTAPSNQLHPCGDGGGRSPNFNPMPSPRRTAAYALAEIADNVVEIDHNRGLRADDGQGVLTLLQAGSPGIPGVTGEIEMVNEWRLQFGRSGPLRDGGSGRRSAQPIWAG
ncbi:MAG: hypothetical protein R2838_10225 [Caldilineaceae bacterium]